MMEPLKILSKSSLTGHRKVHSGAFYFVSGISELVEPKKFSAISVTLIYICASFLSGCATAKPLEVPHLVTLDRVQINVIPSPAHFPEISFFHGAVPIWVQGLATRENQIFVIGHYTPTGRIAVNPEILGHELQHLMNYQDGVFINPDQEGH